MKKILLFFVLFMSMSYIYGQIEVLNETFDQCAMPAGWSVDQTGSASLTPGACSNASFSFECLHNIAYSGGNNPAFSGCVAVMDDDYNSSVTGIYYIISPVLDFSGGGSELTFDYEHADFAGSSEFRVEVWDGATWTEVFAAPHNDHYASVSVDLSAFFNPDAQIRFAYDDEGGWYWGSAFDNVIVTAFEPINPGDFSCILDCPGDLEIFLDPGDCCWNVEYDARTVGNCINHYQNITIIEPPLMGFVGDWDPSGFPVKTALWYQPFNYSHVASFSPSIAGNPNPWPYYDLNNLPDEIVLTTNNHPGQDAVGNCTENGLTDRIAYINWLIPENGTVSFDWDYVSNDGSGDPYWDWFAEARVNNPTYVTSISWATTIADPYSGDPTQSGHFVKNVTAGDYLCLLVQDWGEVFGFAGCGAEVTLSNFQFEIPQPTSGIFVVEGPVPGEEVCPGEETTVKLMLMEHNTPIDSCEFNINVNEYPNPTTTLACNDYVQVSLDNDCSAIIGADMILEGGPYSCYENYLIEVLGVNDGDPTPYVELDAGFYQVGVWDEFGNNCWSTIEVLDKIPPQILCETCPEGGLIQPGDVIEELAGELTADGNDDGAGVTNPCWTVDFPPLNGVHPIDVFQVAVDADGLYSMIMNSSWGDGDMAIYDAPINFDNLCENWIGGANDQGGVGFFDPGLIDFPLNAGQVYYLAISNWATTQNGNYTIALSGDGNFLHQGLPIYGEDCTFYGCNAPGDVLEFPEPEVIENCTYEVTYVDEEIEGPVCGSKFLRRTYTVTDGAGMTATCTQEFLFTGINLDNLAWPTNWDGLPQNNPMLECNIDEYPTLPNGNPDPSYTGYPEGYEDYCGTIEVFFNDINYTSDCGPKILREWTVIDDCTAEIYKHIQIIRITDTTAPTFVLPEDLVANTKGYVCNADFEIPAIMHLEDACDAYPQWFATTNAGFIVGDENENGYVDANETWYVLGVPMGEYDLCYTAVDWCGNYYTECATLTVEDDVPPIPVCEQYKQVSLTPLGDAKVYAEDFDSGSFDNCGPVWFKVLRGFEYNNNNELVYDGGCPSLNGDDNPFTSANDVWFDDDVFFCCDDLGLAHPDGIMVTLRVFDVDPGPGPVSPYDMYNPNGRLYGRYNDCWTVVQVECKIPPLVTAPDMEVSCEDNIDPYVNTALFPDIVSVCGYDAEYTDSDKIGDVCGGYIQRTWTVTGCEKTVTKVQKIYMTATEPFDPCTISFPADDIDILCPNNTGDPGYPTWDENPCNIVTAEIVNIDTFTYVDGACYKIVVDWAVVDWCVYEPNTGAEDNVDAVRNRKLVCNELVEDGYYRYTQILMVTDIYAPEIAVEDQCVATTQGCYAYDVEMFANATDSCNIDEKFWWKYIVTNMDTWETVQYSYNYTPQPDQGQKGSRSKDNLDKTNAASLKFLNPLPLGNYRVEWTVGDGCGNATSTYQYFTVADKKPPTPFLVDISTALMSNGMVEMSARFFDKGACNDQCLASFDDCSDVIYFTFTPIAPVITRPDWIDELHPGLFVYYFDPETGTQFNATSGRTKYFAGDAHYFDPVLNTAGKVFLCADAPATNVDVYVWDNPVNWADGDCDDANYDFATVLLNLNDDGDCGGSLVSGMITANHSGQGIDNVVVAIDNENSTEYPKYMNTTAGEYAFGVLDGDYSVTPTKRDDYLNGVTTLDLVLIQKHLLGLVPLNGDNLIAADANASNSVSAADLFELRELILGVESELNNNDSWVFVPGSQDIVVDGADVTVDFGGIKVGDVNGSADAVEPRSANSVSLVVDEATVEAGLVEVAFTAENFTDVYGAQATLNVSGMKYAGVEAGALNVTDNNFGLVRDGVITMSWNNANGTTVADGTVLFTLKLEAAQNGTLSSMISATSDVTAAEAYTTENLDINGLNISFRGAETVAFELFQNEPNPFAENTVIGFNLPEAGNYTLTVFDVTGKVVKVVTNEGDKGYNSERLDRNDISSGVMYYQLESGEYTATKKMIIIE